MHDAVTLCFDLTPDEYQALSLMARTEGHSTTSYAQGLVKKYLKKQSSTAHSAPHERRHTPRLDVSIPAISLVNFPDNTSRSYPVTIQNISRTGVSVTFSDDTTYLYQALKNATDFELVFTVPTAETTVAFTCKVCRMSIGTGVIMAGAFESRNLPDNSALDSLFN